MAVSIEEAYAGTTRILSLSTPTGSTRRLEVRIPPGVTEGSRIHIAADPTSRGARDDIYLIVNLQPHPVFTREGDDLTAKIQVPLDVAILGGEAQVPSPKGTKLALTIPPETQNQKRIRLRGQGMPHLAGGGNGDLYAEVVVVLPTHLSDEEQELFARLRDLREGAKVPS